MPGQAYTQDGQPYLPAMGKHWLLPLYDPFSWLARVGRVHGQLLDRAELGPGQRVLEIGCGTGNLLTALGRRGPAVDAVGLDPDPAALRRARRKAARSNLPITYEQGFAGALPFPDDGFDRVLSAFMLHHLDEDERLRALQEVRRVLRPGGQLHVVDVDGTPTGQPGRRKAPRHPRVAASLPTLVLAAMTEAGLAAAAKNGHEQSRIGAYAFYRAEK